MLSLSLLLDIIKIGFLEMSQTILLLTNFVIENPCVRVHQSSKGSWPTG